MKAWEKTEKKIASTFGGKRTRGSGNGNEKGDITTSRYCIESKESSLSPFRFQIGWIRKLIQEAGRKEPVLCIEFYDKTMLYFFQSEEDQFKYDWSNCKVLSLTSDFLKENDVIKIDNNHWIVYEPNTVINLLGE